MEKNLESFNINFKTIDIPAPFAHAISLKGITSNNKGLELELDITYLDREELEDEEIFDEGFTLDDNFKWQGTLSNVWVSEISHYLKEESLSNEKNFSDPTEEVKGEFYFSDGNKIEIINKKSLIYLLQELIQGIFEASGKELPLEIKILNISPDKNEQILSLVFSFSNREVELNLQNGQNEKLHLKDEEWSSFQDLLKLLYTPEFVPEKAILNPPKSSGTFIDPGEGAWYKLGEGVVNPGETESLKPLKNKINSIIEKYFSKKSGF